MLSQRSTSAKQCQRSAAGSAVAALQRCRRGHAPFGGSGIYGIKGLGLRGFRALWFYGFAFCASRFRDLGFIEQAPREGLVGAWGFLTPAVRVEGSVTVVPPLIDALKRLYTVEGSRCKGEHPVLKSCTPAEFNCKE